jgi:hypothetical protein
VTCAEIDQVKAAVGDLALQIDDDFHRLPYSADEVDDISVFINHSNDPNVGFAVQVVWVAMDHIRLDGVVFHHYAMERSDDYTLDYHCGG